MDIYVINLKKRTDRWEKILNKFNYFNLIRIEAIEDNVNGAIGCFKSHQKCIQQAKQNNLKKILVIEDDCDILNLLADEFVNIVKKLDKWLDELDGWKIFFGAGNKIKSEHIIGKIPYEQFNFVNSNGESFQIYETNFLKTAHFVWYNHLVYDWVLSLNADFDYPIDKIWHNKFNCLIIVPFITTQHDDYSDIENKKCSYTKSLKRYERRLIKNLK
jgi:GR25 family glycosyltransferase involved in LPS biosynthesis